jgi:hypothetical protein
MRTAFLILIAATTVSCSATQSTPAPTAAPAPTPVPAVAAVSPQPAPALPAARPTDVDSVEHIIAAVYDVISGPKGAPRDWDRFRSLFHRDGRMTPTGPRKDGGQAARVITPEDYITRSGKFLVDEGFRESGVANRIEQYGNIAHVWSTYEARRGDETAPFMRGINSIQLFNDGTRWWVMSIMWEAETPKTPLPEKYLH